MWALALRTVLAAATYGFSAGLVQGPCQAARNLLKFPLLVLVTAAVCAPAWFLLARFLSPGMTFRRAQGLALRTYHDLAVMLAALSPVSAFLALTATKPVSEWDLGEYRLVLLLNVGFIALCGTLALVAHGRRLVRETGIGRSRGILLLFCWLGISLAAGGQCAWFLRPYYGWSFEDYPFVLGTTPGYRGAASFFEEVYLHLVPG